MEQDQKEYSRVSGQDSYPQDLTPLVQLLLDTSNALNLIEHNLRGEVLKYEIIENPDGQRVAVEKWEKTGLQMMNEEGIKFTISLLQSYLNTNTSLSQFTPEQIATILGGHEGGGGGLHMDLFAVLDDKQWEWEIEAAYKNILARKIMDMVWAALNKAEGAKTLQVIARAHTSTEIREITPKKRSWIPFLK